MKSILLLMCSLLTLQTIAQEDIAHAKVSVVTFDYIPIPGAQIFFKAEDGEKIYSGISDEEGKFMVDLPSGIYTIQLKSVGAAKDYMPIEIPQLSGREVYNDVQIIIRYEEETSFTLSNLHFETNRSVIQPDSFDELDELVKYLELKKDVQIEIAGHTDSDGSDQDNLKLSQERADAVKNYLVSKGIAGDRIIAKGYGESQPVADNSSTEGKALNRRTEIHLLE